MLVLYIPVIGFNLVTCAQLGNVVNVRDMANY